MLSNTKLVCGNFGNLKIFISHLMLYIRQYLHQIKYKYKSNCEEIAIHVIACGHNREK